MSARLLPRLLMTAVLLLPTPLLAQLRFQEGRHYSVVPTPQVSGLAPGKIELTEVFSYLCSHCYQAQGLADELKAALPADAAFTLVHAGFSENWPLFQRAHVTAQLLGVADRNHARVFKGIWESGALPYFDLASGRVRSPLLTMRDVARFYAAGGGVSEADFLRKAASPEADAAVRRAESLVRGWLVGGTPTFVVAGRYRVESRSVSTVNEMKALVNFLIGLERSRLQQAGAAKKD